MKTLRAYIFIDASNLHYFLVNAGWRIDWRKFKTYCENRYSSAAFFYYEGIPSKSQYFDIHPDHKLPQFAEAKKKKKEYFKFLKSLSFKVRHKPVGRVYDNTAGEFKHKCNFDVELTIDALDNMDQYDVFVLVSGDGDFIKLVKYLKGRKKKAVVMAPGERLAIQLAEAANQVIYLEDIEDKIARQK